MKSLFKLHLFHSQHKDKMRDNLETTVDQTEIDRIQMISGLELGKNLIEIARANPGKFSKEDLNHDLVSLIIPQRFKDLSCEELRKQIFDRYIADVSMSMNANYMKGEFSIWIPSRHHILLDKLVAHWLEKGFSVCGSDTGEYETDEHGNKKITIIWC